MFELLQKALLVGIGAASMTKERVETMVGDLIEKGQLTEREGRELVTELLEKSAAAGRDLEEKVGRIVRERLGKMNVATRDDIVRLEAEIARLKADRDDSEAV